jgi:hypothetical protein
MVEDAVDIALYEEDVSTALVYVCLSFRATCKSDPNEVIHPSPLSISVRRGYHSIPWYNPHSALSPFVYSLRGIHE